jgi:hypothetical protein
MGKDSIHLLVAIEKRLNFQTQRDSKIQDEIDGNSLGNRCSIRLSYGTNCGLSRLGFVYKGCVYSTLCRRSHLNVRRVCAGLRFRSGKDGNACDCRPVRYCAAM